MTLHRITTHFVLVYFTFYIITVNARSRFENQYRNKWRKNDGVVWKMTYHQNHPSAVVPSNANCESELVLFLATKVSTSHFHLIESSIYPSSSVSRRHIAICLSVMFVVCALHDCGFMRLFINKKKHISVIILQMFLFEQKEQKKTERMPKWVHILPQNDKILNINRLMFLCESVACVYK